MSVELATAYVSIIPTVRDLRPNLQRQFAPVSGIASEHGQLAGGAFSSAFESATSKVGDSLSRSLKVGGAVVGAAIGAAGVVGVKTAANLEQADIAFTTMLGSADKAKSFLGDLQKFAAKTPFDFPGLQKSASSLISVGIDANKVIPIMTSLGNATSGMGTGAEGVQRATVALQQMQAAGKITGQDLNQLRDSGVPVFELLSAATGKSTEEVAGLAAAGKLGKTELDQLFGALESGKGLERFNGLMEKQSASLAGLWSTAKDDFTVGMAEAITPVIPLLKEGLGGATKFLAETVLPNVATGLTTTVAGIKAFRDGWKDNDGVIAASGFPGFLERTAEFLRGVIDSLPKLDFSGIQAFLGSLGDTGNTGRLLANITESIIKLWPAVKDFATSIPSLFSGALTLLNGVLGFLADHVDTIIQFMPLIVGAFVAWKVASLVLAGAQLASAAATGFHTLMAQRGTAVAKDATLAQWLWNAALNANPITLVIIAIAALVAGLIWFFTQTELGREIFKNVWAFIQGVIDGFVKWFQSTVVPFAQDSVRNIGAVFTWLYDNIIRPVFEGIRGVIAAVIGWFTTTVIPGVQAAVAGVGAVFTWLWENIIGPVFGFIGALIGAWWEVMSFIFRAIVAIIQKVLAPAFVWLWENVIKPVFDGIASVISAWWNGLVMPVFNAVVDFVTKTIPAAFNWLYSNAIKPVFDTIGAVISFWWNTIVMPVFNFWVDFLTKTIPEAFHWLYDNAIKPVFDSIGAVIKSVWEGVIKPVFDALSGFILNTIPQAFRDGVAVIGAVWGGIQEAAKAPIRFIIETVLNDGLIGAFNTVASVLGIPGLPRIALPAGFNAAPAGTASAGTGGRGVHAFQTGGWTGPGGRDDPAGIVHADEFVFTKEQTRRAGVGNLYKMARALGGYATGGLVHPVPNSWVSQWFWSGHNGIDFAADFGTPVYAAAPGKVSQAAFSPFGGGNEIHIDHPSGLQTWYAHLASFAVALGQMVAGGQQIGAVDSTGNSTGNHLHFMVLNGGWPNVLDPAPFLSAAGGQLPEKPAGGGGGAFNPVAAVIDFLVGKFTEAFPAGGKFIELVGGVGKAILTGASDFIAGIFGGQRDPSAGGQKAAAGPHGQALGPLLFDGGGWLENTAGARAVAHHGERPDAVLTHGQWQTMTRIADGAQHGTEVNFYGNVYGDPQHIVDEMEASKRRAAIHANLTAITMGG
jgi:tape measure domain-containing protein